MYKHKQIILPGSVFTASEVEKFRNETAGTKNVVHINNACSSLMPDIVTQAQLDHISLESQIWGYDSAAWRTSAIQNFYTQAARLFNCSLSNIA